MRRSARSRRLAVSLLFASTAASAASAQEPVRYTLRFPAPATHYVEIEATFPATGKAALELMLPVWTPGSYLVREFARNVETVEARTTAWQPLAISKTRKNRWTVQSAGADAVVLRYRVYAHEHAARLNWVEDAYARINGAPTFITLVEQAHRPHDVSIELPAGWGRIVTPLAAVGDAAMHHFRAADYDELVDSPFLLGNPSVRRFSVDGIQHSVVNVGDTAVWDVTRSVADVERIVRAERSLWGSLPYERYIFFNHLTDGNDGIEHKRSTVLFADRMSMHSASGYLAWLDLVGHEFFHAWNVKRLRPVELGPFDYESENYTRSLWIAEGFTDYYSWMLVRRAGLASVDETLGSMSRAIRSLQSTPGRLVQPLELASYDAWIKQYRPDENSVNTSVSYYIKGSVVGLLLDARIRHLTTGRRSLDDVMRLAYQRYSGSRGYTPAEFRAMASEVAGADLTDFFHRAVETTEELDYAEFLDWYGLRLQPSTTDSSRASLGVATRTLDGRVAVAGITRGSAVDASGLDAGDEILAADGARIGGDGITAALASYKPGGRVTLLVSRRGELRQVPVTLGATVTPGWTLTVRADATAEQRARVAEWLAPR